jgi:alpha/beta superfamily hydrolase
MTQETFSINGFFHPIEGIIDLPDSPARCPAVIICHGFIGNLEQGLYATIAEQLVRNHFVVVRFNFTVQKIEADIRVFHVQSEQNDLKAVLNYVAAHPKVDPKCIGAFGHSYGATMLLLLNEPRIKALALGSPRITFDDPESKDWHDEGQTRGFFTHKDLRIDQQFMEQNLQYQEILRRTLQAVTQPTFVFYGEKEALQDISDAITVSKSVPRHKLSVVPATDHAYRQPKNMQLAVANAVLSWFGQKL